MIGICVGLVIAPTSRTYLQLDVVGVCRHTISSGMEGAQPLDHTVLIGLYTVRIETAFSKQCLFE